MKPDKSLPVLKSPYLFKVVKSDSDYRIRFNSRNLAAAKLSKSHIQSVYASKRESKGGSKSKVDLQTSSQLNTSNRVSFLW
jgi:hypothetical protein